MESPLGNYQTNYLGPVLNILYDERFLTNDPFKTYATYDDPRSGLSFKPRDRVRDVERLRTSGLGYHGRRRYGRDPGVQRDITATFAVGRRRFADQHPDDQRAVQTDRLLHGRAALQRARLADRLDWTVGGFYYDGDAVNNQIVSIPFLSMFWISLPNSKARASVVVPFCTMTFPEAAALLDSDPATYTFVNADNITKPRAMRALRTWSSTSRTSWR